MIADSALRRVVVSTLAEREDWRGALRLREDDSGNFDRGRQWAIRPLRLRLRRLRLAVLVLT